MTFSILHRHYINYEKLKVYIKDELPLFFSKDLFLYLCERERKARRESPKETWL